MIINMYLLLTIHNKTEPYLILKMFYIHYIAKFAISSHLTYLGDTSLGLSNKIILIVSKRERVRVKFHASRGSRALWDRRFSWCIISLLQISWLFYFRSRISIQSWIFPWNYNLTKTNIYCSDCFMEMWLFWRKVWQFHPKSGNLNSRSQIFFQ